MTKAIIMGLKVEPRIMDTSQRNHGTRGHHIPYPRLYMHQKGAPLETDVSICAIGGLKEFTSSEYEHHGNHQGPHGTHHEWLLTEIGPIVSVNPR